MNGFNQFTSMPFYVYRIIERLIENDNICKILKYNTYDCLSKPNLTHDEKIALIWTNNDNRMDLYNIFMTNTMVNQINDSKSILQCYRYRTNPDNRVIATLSYKFDFMFGSTIALMDYEGYPCNRGDVMEMEIMKTLNGQDVAGVGYLQYNRLLTRDCGSIVGIGNASTFTGISIVFGTQNGDTGGDGCG